MARTLEDRGYNTGSPAPAAPPLAPAAPPAPLISPVVLPPPAPPPRPTAINVVAPAPAAPPLAPQPNYITDAVQYVVRGDIKQNIEDYFDSRGGELGATFKDAVARGAYDVALLPGGVTPQEAGPAVIKADALKDIESTRSAASPSKPGLIARATDAVLGIAAQVIGLGVGIVGGVAEEAGAESAHLGGVGVQLPSASAIDRDTLREIKLTKDELRGSKLAHEILGDDITRPPKAKKTAPTAPIMTTMPVVHPPKITGDLHPRATRDITPDAPPHAAAPPLAPDLPHAPSAPSLPSPSGAHMPDLSDLVSDPMKMLEQSTPTQRAGLALAGTALTAGAAAGAGYAISRRRKASKAKKSKSTTRRRRKTHHRAKKHAKHAPRRRTSKKHHKPRAHGGTRNGKRIYVAKNGTRYVKKANGQVRFIK